MDNSAMEANRFNKVRSWLTTNKVIRQDVMKSYNFSRLRLSRWLVGSSNSRIEGWWIRFRRGKPWFSRRHLMCASVGEEDMLQTPSVQGGEAPFLDRPVIRQRIEIREEASPSVIARKASSLPSIRRAWATVRLSYCPKCWGT